MACGKTQLNTAFDGELCRAVDEVERSQGSAALITIGGEEKFYSDGLGLERLR